MSDTALTESGMYKDIMAQPECWARLLDSDLGAFTSALRQSSVGLIVGMGASHFAALAAQFALASNGAIWLPVTADVARNYLPLSPAYDTVIALSQSGESADTVAAVERLIGGKTRLLTITNTPGSRLARLGQPTLDLGCGEEKGSATKTYTATILALLAAAYGDGLQWSHLLHTAQEILSTLDQDDAPADLLDPQRRHYFLGAGPNRATAWEAALVCKEKLFLSVEGDGAADFIHGPLEALDDKSTVWLFSTNERLDDLLVPLARRVAATGASLVVIGEGVEAYTAAGLTPIWSYPIELDGPSELGTILFILPIQLLVLYETARRGYPIDTFRRMGKVMSSYSYGLTDAS